MASKTVQPIAIKLGIDGGVLSGVSAAAQNTAAHFAERSCRFIVIIDQHALRYILLNQRERVEVRVLIERAEAAVGQRYRNGGHCRDIFNGGSTAGTPLVAFFDLLLDATQTLG